MTSGSTQRFGSCRTEPGVVRDDLRPVGLCGGSCIGVDCGDGRLQLVRPGAADCEAPAYERVPLGDEPVVPERAVLVCQAHQRAVLVDAGSSSCLREQHESEQPDGFGLVG